MKFKVITNIIVVALLIAFTTVVIASKSTTAVDATKTTVKTEEVETAIYKRAPKLEVRNN